LKTESCATVTGRNVKNYCIRAIYIQSRNDLIIQNYETGLQYKDLSDDSATATAVVFQGDNAVFAKSEALQVYKDSDQIHVCCRYFFILSYIIKFVYL
jgi:hypothetical protein